MDPTTFFPLPTNLPVPQDDGACRHLPGARLPDLALPSTSGAPINLSERADVSVVYVYPLTGRPGIDLPPGWDEIPGARGCTPESCAFRDHHAEIRSCGAEVFGLSSQSSDYQREAQTRLHLSRSSRRSAYAPQRYRGVANPLAFGLANSHNTGFYAAIHYSN